MHALVYVVAEDGLVRACEIVPWIACAALEVLALVVACEHCPHW